MDGLQEIYVRDGRNMVRGAIAEHTVRLAPLTSLAVSFKCGIDKMQKNMQDFKYLFWHITS
jgi:hypothetical protein